ncbi:DUF3054 domain-containing protein [Microbacterium sp. 18062]|uniref:DUF3054 domain-containing protein n=1 Tax=Microbacterium sp. 18062 TaxID=2681410 RepID=UPI00135B4941|nr:DUF3054 domain-containing protein [Microbacterium sp. 18062]
MTHRTRTAVTALVVDAVLVVVFAAFGRAAHAEGVLGPWGAGLAQTAWPFLAALALGWLVTMAWRRPTAPLATGVGVWAVTVAGGMLLRTATGQGTAVAFVVVAAVTLLVLLVGWRTIDATVRRRRQRSRPSSR